MGIEFYLVFIPILLICITVHEFAHAKVADMLGDPTPRYAGRLTLNPLSHLDPIGFLALLIVRIGWAKPVPVNPYNFKDPERGMMMVGLAGPAANFILAWFLAVIVRTVPLPSYFWVSVLHATIWINLALMVFNLLPIPPLDGSRIFTRYFSAEVQFNLERYGFLILLAVIIFPPTQFLILSIIQFFFNLLV